MSRNTFLDMQDALDRLDDIVDEGLDRFDECAWACELCNEAASEIRWLRVWLHELVETVSSDRISAPCPPCLHGQSNETPSG